MPMDTRCLKIHQIKLHSNRTVMCRSTVLLLNLLRQFGIENWIRFRKIDNRLIQIDQWMIIDRPVCARLRLQQTKKYKFILFSLGIPGGSPRRCPCIRSHNVRQPRSKTTAEILCIQKFVTPNSPLNRVFFYVVCWHSCDSWSRDWAWPPWKLIVHYWPVAHHPNAN